ncbi:MAG: helix-turn-helix domain-containing protein [Segatella copri]
MMTVLADRIKKLRKKKGISQLQLAEAIGVKKNTVSTWERGTRKPDLNALYLLSEYFEVSYEYLLGTSDEEETRFKPSQEDLDFYALSDKAEEIKESTELLCRLSDKSRKIVEELIATIYRTENRNDELTDGKLDIEIRVKR